MNRIIGINEIDPTMPVGGSGNNKNIKIYICVAGVLLAVVILWINRSRNSEKVVLEKDEPS